MNPSEHVLTALSRRYPQLLLPLSYDTKNTRQYKDAVLRGEEIEGAPDFTFSPDDSLTVCDTPVGKAEILYLSERKDFEHCLQALAYRCEPRPIPGSVGANTISGLINWEKIRRHRAEYEAAGGSLWGLEFRRFTRDAANYRDTILVLGSGWYSAVSPEETGLSDAEWTERSLTIRKYHELTHFVCRRLYPDDIDAVRDEVFADMIGLIAAFGEYDPKLALRFLGIDGKAFRPGGRLEHYLSDGAGLEREAIHAGRMISVLRELSYSFSDRDVLQRIRPLFEAFKKNTKEL